MSNNERCPHNKVARSSLIQEVLESQAGSGRHRCVVCAYDQGYNIANACRLDYIEYCNTFKTDLELCKHGSLAPTTILINLGANQGGSGRHKCTNCAFKRGFEEYNSNITVIIVGSHHLIKEVSVPIIFPNKRSIKQQSQRSKNRDIDYLQREIKNRSLGLLGEEAVLYYENSKLRKLGIKKTAKHISKDLGDFEGYDILSYDENNIEIYIEVKTTRLPNSHAFFITKNELEFSKNNRAKYFLYRLFDFNPQTLDGKFYILKGNIETESTLMPVIYQAIPNYEKFSTVITASQKAKA